MQWNGAILWHWYVIILYFSFLTELLSVLLYMYVYRWDQFCGSNLVQVMHKPLLLSNIHCFNWHLFSMQTRQSCFPILGSSLRSVTTVEGNKRVVHMYQSPECLDWWLPHFRPHVAKHMKDRKVKAEIWILFSNFRGKNGCLCNFFLSVLGYLDFLSPVHINASAQCLNFFISKIYLAFFGGILCRIYFGWRCSWAACIIQRDRLFNPKGNYRCNVESTNVINGIRFLKHVRTFLWCEYDEMQWKVYSFVPSI